MKLIFVFSAGMMLGEIGIIATHPAWSRAVMRTVYVFGWDVANALTGADIPTPNRFQ